MTDIVLAVAAYVLGSIPSAYVFSRLFERVDVRRIGSGNVGAVNVLAHVGILPGALTLAVDLGKAALAVYLATRYGRWAGLPLCCTTLVVLGHDYSMFLHFGGGKGLACLVGALLVLWPAAILYVFSIVGILALVFRSTTVGAGLGVFSLPVLLWLRSGDWLDVVMGTATAVLILTKHWHNFRDYRAARRRRPPRAAE